MEELEHPLDMTVLKVQDRVSGYSSLNPESIDKLMTLEDFSELGPQLRKSVLGDYLPSPFWLVAEVDGSAIIVTHQWVVSIHGDSLVHCISALMKYRNAFAKVLDTSVVGEIQTPIASNTGPLREHVIRRENTRRSRNYRGKALWLLAGGILGMILGILGNVIAGGVIQ